MSDTELTSAISAWELTAKIGYVFVILGCVFEGAELAVKWGKKRKLRIWIGEIFERERRRKIVLFIKWLKPKVLSVETFGFAFLVGGLGLELLAGHIAGSLQHTENVRLKLQAENAGKGAALANQLAGEANDRAETNALAAARLDSTNLLLRAQIVELEKAMAPRIFRDQGGAIQRLMKYSWTNTIIVHERDVESQRTAGQIRYVIGGQRYKSDAMPWLDIGALSFDDGVKIEVSHWFWKKEQYDRSLWPELADKALSMREQANALAAELNATEIRTTVAEAGSVIPFGWIVLRVGFKPSLQLTNEASLSPTNRSNQSGNIRW